MPLHPQKEGFRAGHGYRLDLAIGRVRLGFQTGRQPVHPLMMQGIDHRITHA